jgi:hypothetical protein
MRLRWGGETAVVTCLGGAGDASSGRAELGLGGFGAGGAGVGLGKAVTNAGLSLEAATGRVTFGRDRAKRARIE